MTELQRLVRNTESLYRVDSYKARRALLESTILPVEGYVRELTLLTEFAFC